IHVSVIQDTLVNVVINQLAWGNHQMIQMYVLEMELVWHQIHVYAMLDGLDQIVMLQLVALEYLLMNLQYAMDMECVLDKMNVIVTTDIRDKIAVFQFAIHFPQTIQTYVLEAENV